MGARTGRRSGPAQLEWRQHVLGNKYCLRVRASLQSGMIDKKEGMTGDACMHDAG